ncbi:DNA repair RAD51 -like protein, partial [Brachionus plicatilis]
KMSSKPLSSLKIPRNILEKLHHHSIYKIQDLITKAPMELVKLLSIPLQKVQLIFDTCFENLAFDPTNALDLIKKNPVEEKLPNDNFDKLICEIGILRRGLLSEVCGPPGVGKTQFLTQLCITNSLIYPESSTIYIDTENNFSSKRFLEIASEKFLTKEKSEEDLIKMTKNIFVFKKFTISEFEEILRFIECEIITRNSSLLIIDSLASIVRREYSGSDSSILNERSLFLSKCSSKLKAMAEYLEVSVKIFSKFKTYVQLKFS